MPEQTEETGYKIFNNPVSVAKRSNQKVHLVAREQKAAMLAHIVTTGSYGTTVVVTKTKRDADDLENYLKSCDVKAVAIHANRSKTECEEAAKAFKSGECNILITTDMNLQALGIKDLGHVVSYDLPSEPEHYLYRMGCMGEKGQAVALVSPDENSLLYAIERVMKRAIPQEEVEGFRPEPSEQTDAARPKKQKEKPRHRVQKRKTGPKPRTDRKPRDDKERSDRKSGGERKEHGKKPGDRKGEGKKPAAKKETPKKRPVRRITLDDQKKKASS